VVGDYRRREESGDLEPAVTVGRTHHRNLDPHVVQTSDATGPVSFDQGSPFEVEPKFGEELDCGIDILNHDSDVVHPLDSHIMPRLKIMDEIEGLKLNRGPALIAMKRWPAKSNVTTSVSPEGVSRRVVSR
jgi:hypothetical protein